MMKLMTQKTIGGINESTLIEMKCSFSLYIFEVYDIAAIYCSPNF